MVESPLEAYIMRSRTGKGPELTSGAGSPQAPSHAVRSTFRAHERRSTRLRALVTHVATGWQRNVSVENIGLGGACILLDEPVAPGDLVSVSFTAPALWDQLVLRARIAWATPNAIPFRTGLTFDHRSAEAALALYELIVAHVYE